MFKAKRLIEKGGTDYLNQVPWSPQQTIPDHRLYLSITALKISQPNIFTLYQHGSTSQTHTLTCIHTHTHTHTHSHRQTHTHSLTHSHRQTHTHTHTHSHSHRQSHTLTHIDKHTHTHLHTHTHTFTHTLTHSHTHIYTHTYTHTHTHTHTHSSAAEHILALSTWLIITNKLTHIDKQNTHSHTHTQTHTHWRTHTRALRDMYKKAWICSAEEFLELYGKVEEGARNCLLRWSGHMFEVPSTHLFDQCFCFRHITLFMLR